MFGSNDSILDRDNLLDHLTHLPIFNDLLDLCVFFTSAGRSIMDLERTYGASWERDCGLLAKAIDSFCPKWQPRREHILADKKIWQAL